MFYRCGKNYAPRFRGLRALGVNVERLLSPKAAAQNKDYPVYREAAYGQKQP